MREITSLTSSVNILRIAGEGSSSLSSAAHLADLNNAIADLRNEVTTTTTITIITITISPTL